MREFVGEQMLAAFTVRLVLPGSEDNVLAHGIGERMHVSRGLARRAVVVDADAVEVLPESGFHERLRRGVERPSRLRQCLMHGSGNAGADATVAPALQGRILLRAAFAGGAMAHIAAARAAAMQLQASNGGERRG